MALCRDARDRGTGWRTGGRPVFAKLLHQTQNERHPQQLPAGVVRVRTKRSCGIGRREGARGVRGERENKGRDTTAEGGAGQGDHRSGEGEGHVRETAERKEFLQNAPPKGTAGEEETELRSGETEEQPHCVRETL